MARVTSRREGDITGVLPERALQGKPHTASQQATAPNKLAKARMAGPSSPQARGIPVTEEHATEEQDHDPTPAQKPQPSRVCLGRQLQGQRMPVGLSVKMSLGPLGLFFLQIIYHYFY